MSASLDIRTGYGFIIPGDEDWDYDREALIERIAGDEANYSEDFYDIVMRFVGLNNEEVEVVSYGVHDYIYGYLISVKATGAYSFDGTIELESAPAISTAALKELDRLWQIVYPDKAPEFKYLGVASYL